jgi:hypothetical protein
MFTLEILNANRGALLRVRSVNYMLLKRLCCKDGVRKRLWLLHDQGTGRPQRSHVIVVGYGKYVMGSASC